VGSFTALIVRLRPFLPVLVLTLLIVYFGFQALTGDRGLLSLSQRNELLAAKRGELAKLEAQRKDLEARAHLMRDGSVSRDLVEERARYLLGFSDPRDYVIRTKQ
jgi:cell division protein FtsB